jgi:hypothetical protein
MELNGVAVNFGFSGAATADKSSGIAITELKGVLLQSAEQTKASDMDTARSGQGDEIAHGHYNFHDEATIEYIVAGTAIGDGVTSGTAVFNSVPPLAGTFVTITACASQPDLVTSKWEVQPGAKVVGSNTNFKRMTVPIKRYANITAAASQ